MTCTEPSDEFATKFATSNSSSRFHHPVFDSKNRRVRGLWNHEGTFYSRIKYLMSGGKWVDRRVKLKASTLAEARIEQALLKAVDRTEPDRIKSIDVKFGDFVNEYLDRARMTKRSSTVSTEAIHLNHWSRGGLENTCLCAITKGQILEIRDQQLKKGWSPRTANLAVTVLRNLFRTAIDQGVIQVEPTSGIHPLRHVPLKRQLFTTQQIEHLANTAAKASHPSGTALADFLRICAYAGTRYGEAKRLKWSDVKWDQKQLMVGSDGLAKNHEARFVDLNPILEKLLYRMEKRRVQKNEYLFSPSGKSGPYKTLRQTLLKARKAANLPDFGFHDCRHHFISYCIMSGIDYLTIAKWVGHKDGGVLIGKVYGHLSSEHLRNAAQRMKFG